MRFCRMESERMKERVNTDDGKNEKCSAKNTVAKTHFVRTMRRNKTLQTKKKKTAGTTTTTVLINEE